MHIYHPKQVSNEFCKDFYEIGSSVKYRYWKMELCKIFVSKLDDFEVVYNGR